MDEEEVKKVIISATSDLDRPQPAVRRNSTGKTGTKSSPSRFSSDEKLLPNYLRASTGSCHDFCKHGTKHVFEPKKRLPTRRLPDSCEISEKKQSEVKTVQRRSKRPELHLITIPQPKEVEIHVSHIHSVQGEVSFEASESINLSVEHSLSIEGEEPSEEHLDVKSPSLNYQTKVSEVFDTMYLESLSPVEKRITSEEPAVSVAWSERSVDGPESIKLIHAAMKDVEGSPDEILGVKMTTTESNAAYKCLKPETLTPTKKTTSSVKASPSSRDNPSVKALSTRVKAPSMTVKSVAAAKEQDRLRNLKKVEVTEKKVTRTNTTQLKSDLTDRTKDVREKRIELTGQSTLAKKNIPSTVQKRSKISEQKCPSSVEKVIMSASPRVSKQNSSGITKHIDSPARSSISSKSRTPVTKSAPSLLSSARLTTQRGTKNIMSRSINLSSRSSLEIPSLKLVKNRSLKSSSALKKSLPIVGKLENSKEKVKEKTLYVVEPKREKKQLTPIKKVVKKSKEDSSSQTKSEAKTEKKQLTPIKKVVKKSKEDSSSQTRSEPKRIQRSTPVKTEEKLISPHKVKFRRGKVVNPETENNAPRKLMFRQAKGASEKNCKEVGIVIRRRRLSLGSSADLTAHRLEAPKVVLRHQDVKEKKEIQGLLNQVIEETASKLVETRKSKVKALVGAFETVILLHESRVAPIV